MRNSISSEDQITIKLKTKTNSSGFQKYLKKELSKSITDERPDFTIESSINHNPSGDHKMWYGMPPSNHKFPQKVKESQSIPETYNPNPPLSPNSKRVQQLQLFRFDDKIQEIQSQEIQQLINQQIKASKDKELQKISQLLNKSPIHLNHSNAFRLFKRTSMRISKGASSGNEHNSRYGNKTVQGTDLGNSKLGFVCTRNQPGKNVSQLLDRKPHTKSIVINQGTKTEGDLGNFKIEKAQKQTASLPVWQRNIFHQKILTRQNNTKIPMSKTYFSTTNQNPAFFSNSPKRNTESPQKLSQIQESISVLKNKSFSIKKNYEFFISKLNSSNPEVQEQLIDELEKSKMNERLLLDSNCKSFSGYCKSKSFMYNRQGVYEKTKGEAMEQNGSSNDLYRNATNITSYKFNHLKPLRLRLSKKNKKQLLLFEECVEPKIRREQLYEGSQESQEEVQDSEYGIQPKFREHYKDKHDEKEIERYIAERQKVSREAASPYHDLSAWS